MNANAAPGRTFIKATEFWVPNADRSQLEFGGGLYGPAARMARLSRDACFGRDEGLPGKAWDSGAPVVLHSFEGSYFKRTEAALADGLSCGIALPIFMGDYLSAVVVFFCGDDEDHVGAIEVWHTDTAGSGKDMNLADGYYGRTGDTFEYTSRRTSFRQGTGLPGLAWQKGTPVFMPDLGRAAGFLRGDSASKVGINRGFAMLCSTPGPEQYVLAFLSALGTPIARRAEIWLPDGAGTRLSLHAGFCEQAGELHDGDVTLQRGQGSVGLCWLNGLPVMSSDMASEPGPAAQVSGLTSVAVLPVLSGGRFNAAVALYF